MKLKALIWLVIFPPIGIYLLLKKEKSLEPQHPDVEKSSKPNSQISKSASKSTPKVSVSSNPSSKKTYQNSTKTSPIEKLQTIGEQDLNKQLTVYEDNARSTNKYMNFLRFRQEKSKKSGIAWVTHYGNVDLESSEKYAFLATVLTTDKFVCDSGKSGNYISPFGWSDKFEIDYEKVKTTYSNKNHAPSYTGVFSPQFLNYLVENHSNDLDDLLESEKLAKYVYVVLLVGSHDFPKIDQSAFETVLSRFPSFELLKKSSISKLSEVQGISRATATTLKENVEEIYLG